MSNDKPLYGRDLKAMGYDIPEGFEDRLVQSVSLEAVVTHADGTVEDHGKVYEKIYEVPFRATIKKFIRKYLLRK